MKKIFLAISMVALFAAGAYAQGISGGVKAGVNIANQKFEGGGDSENGDSKVGFQIGGYANISLAEKFGIQPELLYSMSGSKDFVNMGYINIPVMLRYNINENVNIQAGPQLGFLLSAKSEEGDVDVKDAFSGTDFGAAFGVGLEFGKINAGARYYLGLSNSADQDYWEQLTEINDFSIKNSAIQVFVGLKLFGE